MSTHESTETVMWRLMLATEGAQLILLFQETFKRHGENVNEVSRDETLTRTWEEAQPESRANLLMSVAYTTRERENRPERPDRHGAGAAEDYAEDLHQYAKAFEGTITEWCGPDSPLMPLPGPAGALASSVAFDREDTDISLMTAALLYGRR